MGEFDTVRKLLKGFSIARFGDGEVKMMDRHVYTRELRPVPALAREMKSIAARPHPTCLIGIPTMDPNGAKYENWQRHLARFTRYFHTQTGLKYYSALITRPDSGAWMESREYYDLLIRLWAGKRVAVVAEPTNKLLAHVRETNEVFHVECPSFGAFAQIDRLERETLAASPEIALLSCGPTATVLANRLSKRVQAIDIGSVGGFLQRWKD